MADDLKRPLSSYSKDELIRRYDLTEYYGKNLTDVRKIPKIELMEDIYGSGRISDDDEFAMGGLVGISSLSNNFMDPNTDTSYGSIEELEQAVMAKKQPPSDTGGIMGLVMGGPPKFGGLIEGPGTGTSDSIPGMIYQDGVPVQKAALSNEEFVMTRDAVKGAGNGDMDKGIKAMYDLMNKFESMA